MLTWFQIGLLVEQTLWHNDPDYLSYEVYDQLMDCPSGTVEEYNNGVIAAWACELGILEEEDGTDQQA